MDRHWNVLSTNEAAPRFFKLFLDMAARQGPRNVLHLVFDPHGLRPFVDDWPTLARSLLQRVHREAVGRVIDGGTRRLHFSMVTSVGTPQTVAAQELRLESMFPADEATEVRHRELMAAAGAR